MGQREGVSAVNLRTPLSLPVRWSGHGSASCKLCAANLSSLKLWTFLHAGATATQVAGAGRRSGQGRGTPSGPPPPQHAADLLLRRPQLRMVPGGASSSMLQSTPGVTRCNAHLYAWLDHPPSAGRPGFERLDRSYLNSCLPHACSRTRWCSSASITSSCPRSRSKSRCAADWRLPRCRVASTRTRPRLRCCILLGESPLPTSRSNKTRGYIA